MKIARVLFWGGLILDGVSLLQRIWENIKMIDMRIILEIGILVLIIICGCIILFEKYKKFKNRISELEKWTYNYPNLAARLDTLIKEPENRVAAIDQLSKRVNHLEQDVYRVVKRKEINQP